MSWDLLTANTESLRLNRRGIVTPVSQRQKYPTPGFAVNAGNGAQQ
jgi:hypothetical protein